MEPSARRSDSGASVSGSASEEKENENSLTGEVVSLPSSIELYSLRTQCPDYRNGGDLILTRLFKSFEGALKKKNDFLDAWVKEEDYSSDEDSDEDSDDEEQDYDQNETSVEDLNIEEGKKRKRKEKAEKKAEKKAQKKARKREKYYNSDEVYLMLRDDDEIACSITKIRLDLTKDFVCEI